MEHILKQLILDDDFNSLQSMANEEINMMNILNVSTKELQHSNLLAWMFNPSESHQMGDFFIKEFIKLYYKENEYQNLGPDASSLTVFDFVKLNFDDLEIRREYKNIDILLLSKKNNLCIMIENKILSREGKGQLKKYREVVETEYGEYKYKIYIYLSLFEQSITESEQNHYVKLTYQHVKKLISRVLTDDSISISKNAKFVLEQYLQTLKSLMNENQQIEKLAKELYKRYKSAIDLVYKYASPSSPGLVPHNLNDLILAEEHIRPFSSSKTYVRFVPNFLFDNFSLLNQKGYITSEDHLNQYWLFLFEFYVTSNSIQFDMKIGDYPNQDCRRRLFELYSNHQDVFTKVVRGKGTLNAKWHLVFQKKMVKAHEYEKYLETLDESYLFTLISSRFRELIDTDLKKIEYIILKDH